MCLPRQMVRNSSSELPGWRFFILVAILILPSLARPCQALGQAPSSSADRLGNSAAGQRSIEKPDSSNHNTANHNDTIDNLLTKLALEHVPKLYVDQKKWGGQAERWDGIKFEIDDGKLETRRRKKLVNDGTWKKYSVSLRNPAEEFRVQLRNVKESETGNLTFEIHVQAHVDFDGQQVEWKKGVKLLSLSAEGHARIAIQVNMVVDIATDGKKFPPDIVLRPEATQARIMLHDFRIDRIGKIGGEIAQQISAEAHDRLNAEMPEQEKKLLEKINRELTRKEGGFRFSFDDLKSSKWNEAMSSLLNRK